jgi:hypothetical protein
MPKRTRKETTIPALPRANFVEPLVGPLQIVWCEPVLPRPRKGPAPGTVDRYGAADRALYSELKRLMREGRSATAAARQLADDGKVAGVGSPESRTRRLANRYLAESRKHDADTR